MSRAEEISSNIGDVRTRIANACASCIPPRSPNSVKLICVTKTYPLSDIEIAFAAGATDIGENRVQELEDKVPNLIGKPQIHLIGHLQTNKVAKAAALADWIHSVDSLRVLERLESACSTLNKTMNILVQVNTSGEDSKSGCSELECAEICAIAAKSSFCKLHGLMTIGPLDGSDEENRASFRMLKRIAESNRQFFRDGSFELSMGMSNDFEAAIQEGATMIRVGSLIFGKRIYK